MASIWVKIAAMSGGFLVFGAIAVHGPFGASAIEANVETAARQHLRSAGVDWASARADGRRIVLVGTAPDHVALSKAVDLFMARGDAAIADIDTSRVVIITDSRPIDDYRFAARINGERLTISGAVPDAETRETLLAPFSKDHSLEISDETEIAPIDEIAAWTGAAKAGLAALSILGDGALVIDGRSVSITGAADDVAAADTAKSMIAGAPDGFDYAVAIDRSDLSRNAADDTAQSRSLCQNEINRSVNGRKLTFAANSDLLGASERAMLDAFATEIQACAGVDIAIEGHTDSTGAAAYNLQLSERRADAVRRYLESRIEKIAFQTRAYGETRPIASNSTNAGRQRNRRIDFVVADTELQIEGANAP